MPLWRTGDSLQLTVLLQCGAMHMQKLYGCRMVADRFLHVWQSEILVCVRRLNNPSATLFGFVGENKTQASYILTLASPKINDDDEVQLKLFA